MRWIHILPNNLNNASQHFFITGYKNLDTLRELLQPILLRRTRKSVMMELPERTTEVVRIRPTDEQKGLSDEHARASMIAAKDPRSIVGSRKIATVATSHCSTAL